MNRDEPSTPEGGQKAATAYLYVLALVPALIFGGIVLVFVLTGSTAPTTRNASGLSQAEESNLDTARQTLNRQTDLNSCRLALQQVNAELNEKPALRPPALTEEQKNWLHQHIGLDDDELNEIQSGTFTRLDGIHLEHCFLMRDVARALQVKGTRGAEAREKPLDQAVRAFAWTVRQVRLRPRSGVDVSPVFALRRGWGSPRDRALVFLDLLQQLGDPSSSRPEMAGCLLHVPDKDGRRLWACGVVIGEDKEMYLFDPRLGLPLPGPNGEGIATLSAVRKDPALLAQLNINKENAYDVTAEQARAAQAWFVPSLSALSPRMRYLQENVLAPAVRIRLAVDPAREFERVTAACGGNADKTPPVQIPKERVTFLRQFLPRDEGGIDEGVPVRPGDPRKVPRKLRATLELVPREYLPSKIRDNPNFPLDSVLGERVQQLFAASFIRSALDPGQSRDLLLRGRYSSAEPELVNEREHLLDQQKERAASPDLDRKVDRWVDEATRLYALVLRASPQERDAAEQRAKGIWDVRIAAPFYALLFSAVAQARNPEISYQLGLCAQEQAEQLQTRLDLQKQAGAAPSAAESEKAQQAWQDALSAWKRHEEDYPAHEDLGAARRLRGRAESQCGDWQAAVTAWRKPTDSQDKLEKLASLYLAQQLEKQHAKKRMKDEG